MNQKLQAPRGTQDLLPETCRAFRKIDEIAFQVAEKYGFEEISTPIFEFSEVFHRTLGETSDMVSKETYTFSDRGGDSITLRPEGTAGIARAFISNGLAQNLPLKFYYHGPMFRYERPQKGRYRQFHQLGVECLGFESPLADVEAIAMASALLKKIGIEQKVELRINSLGDSESRKQHRDQLFQYLLPFENELSADSKIRLHKNPLRILDSKDANDQKIVANAPQLKNCLNEKSQQFFQTVLAGLEALKIPFKIDQQLVRGIDYYTHTVFEFVTSELGAQGAVIAGGRYDGLIEQMGGSPTPGVGWASGIERLSLLVSPELLKDDSKKIAVISADESTELFCLEKTIEIRNQGLIAEMPMGGNMGKKMKKASKMGAHFAVIVGQSEMAEQKLTLKNLNTGEQTQMPFSEFPQFLKSQSTDNK